MAETFLNVFRMLATLERLRMFLERFENISVLCRAETSRLCILTIRTTTDRNHRRGKPKVLVKDPWRTWPVALPLTRFKPLRNRKLCLVRKMTLRWTTDFNTLPKIPGNQFSKVSFSNIILSMLFIKNCCKNDEVSRMF